MSPVLSGLTLSLPITQFNLFINCETLISRTSALIIRCWIQQYPFSRYFSFLLLLCLKIYGYVEENFLIGHFRKRKSWDAAHRPPQKIVTNQLTSLQCHPPLIKPNNWPAKKARLKTNFIAQELHDRKFKFTRLNMWVHKTDITK